MKRGITLLRIGGIQVVIDYSWFVVFFLVVYTMASGYFPRAQGQLSGMQYWFLGFVAAVLIFVSILLHEMAHSLVAIRHGIRVRRIWLFIFGGVAEIETEPRSGRQEFLIALAGPAASMVLSLMFGALWAATALGGGSQGVAAIAWYLFLANGLVAGFNLIPGFPLDGGRILRAVLWDRWDDMARATKVVSRIGNGFAMFLIVFGLLQIVALQSFISGLWMVFIGLFIRQSATGSYRAVIVRQALAGIHVRQVMSDRVITVDWLTSVEGLVRDFIYRHRLQSFPVLHQDEMLGMVSLDQVKAVPKELWAFKQVRDIMTPMEQVSRLDPQAAAAEALHQMIQEGVERLPVMEDCRLVGMVSRGDILALYRVKTDLDLA